MIIIIGGGAAGMYCAVNAARTYPQKKVLVLEKTSKLLSKVKVSGGGRCNVTHACDHVSQMIDNYPRGRNFLKKAFSKHFVGDTISWFAERNVSLKTEVDGRMFPTTDNSETIIECLLREADKYGVEIRMNTAVQSISQNPNGGFDLQITSGMLTAEKLCIACGGKSKLPDFNFLSELGHNIIAPVPSLFTFNLPKNKITELMGVSIPKAEVKITGTKLKNSGPLLITHWGMSGPCILKLSSLAAIELAAMQYDFSILVNWVGGQNENDVRKLIQEVRFKEAAKKIINFQPFDLPKRFWEYTLATCGIPPDMRWADLPAKEQNLLIKNLTTQPFPVKGKTTFKEEFVTAGGIDTAEVDPLTMESRLCKGLFFAGEILNVDGVTGGFNFQNAWTTGFVAASNLG